MENNDVKFQHIAMLAENSQSATVKSLLYLLELMIADARISNDTATGGDFIRNQGKISGYKLLREYITRPAIPKIR